MAHYGNESHPDQHTPVFGNNRDPPTQGESHPDPHPPVNTNSDNPATLGEEGSNEDANKSDRTKRSCEDASDRGDENRNMNEQSQEDEDMNATFPVITTDGFRSEFNIKMESGEDSKPAKKRTKHGGDEFDDPYDFDNLKPPLQEFTPDNNRRVVGSLASYVGLRLNSAGREVPFSEDVKRQQATWPYSQQLSGAFLNKNLKEIVDIFRHENIQIGLFPQMRH